MRSLDQACCSAYLGAGRVFEPADHSEGRPLVPRPRHRKLQAGTKQTIASGAGDVKIE